MSKRYPTEQETMITLANLTQVLVNAARRRDRAREALSTLTTNEQIGLLCELLGVDEDWLIETLLARLAADKAVPEPPSNDSTAMNGTAEPLAS